MPSIKAALRVVVWWLCLLAMCFGYGFKPVVIALVMSACAAFAVIEEVDFECSEKETEKEEANDEETGDDNYSTDKG